MVESNIPKPIVDVVNTTLDTLQKIAEERQKSAALLAAAIGEIRFFIEPPEEDSDWMEDPSEDGPETSPELPKDQEYPCDHCTCENGCSKAEKKLTNCRKDIIDPIEQEKEKVVQALLTNIGRIMRERSTDGYSIAKNRIIKTAEIDIWEAFNDMIVEMVSSEMTVEKMLLDSFIKFHNVARN